MQIVKEEQIKEEGERIIKRWLKILIRLILGLLEWGLARLIAVWQLIRGFIIGFTAGPDFREGWLLICARIIGILIPSFIDHNPHDYVNATRLASKDLFTNNPSVY